MHPATDSSITTVTHSKNTRKPSKTTTNRTNQEVKRKMKKKKKIKCGKEWESKEEKGGVRRRFPPPFPLQRRRRLASRWTLLTTTQQQRFLLLLVTTQTTLFASFSFLSLSLPFPLLHLIIKISTLVLIFEKALTFLSYYFPNLIIYYSLITVSRTPPADWSVWCLIRV